VGGLVGNGVGKLVGNVGLCDGLGEGSREGIGLGLGVGNKDGIGLGDGLGYKDGD